MAFLSNKNAVKRGSALIHARPLLSAKSIVSFREGMIWIIN